ncbi:MAG: ribonuclease HI family protein [Thermoleophilaceae bacterium]
MKVVVHVDGGARGNPGPAAAGAVAADPGGEVLLERGLYIGEATNNVAEYRAVLLGLELARELGASDVEVVNDSELVSKQIGGQYKVKHAGLKPLYLEAMRELRGFEKWKVRSVRRESNERADELVNQALDAERL